MFNKSHFHSEHWILKNTKYCNLLTVLFGWVATIIPQVYTYYISTALFALFGLKMLYEGYHMSSTEAQEEIEEVQSDLRKRDDEVVLQAVVHLNFFV